MFAVVEFVGSCEDDETSNEIAVVPQKWLYKHDKRCFWPNRLGKFNKFDDLVKANEEHKSTWPAYKVYAVHKKTDKFEEAEGKLTELLRERNYETDTSGSSLSRKRVVTYANESEHRDESTSSISNVSLATTRTMSCMSYSSSSPQCFDDAVLQQVIHIKTVVDQQSIMMKEILRNTRTNLTEFVSEAPPGFPTLPFTNYEEFIAFDHLLAEDSVAAKYLKSKLSAVGGTGIEHVVRRVMKHLITNEVGCEFNWKGRGSKKSFEKMNCVKIIKDAAKQNFLQAEKNDLIIENTIKDWLKYSPTRVALSAKKS